MEFSDAAVIDNLSGPYKRSVPSERRRTRPQEDSEREEAEALRHDPEREARFLAPESYDLLDVFFRR